MCSFLLILGSFTPWISVSIDGHGFASVAGTDSGVSQLIGVNGWITFSAGILLFILGCMIVVSGDAFFRSERHSWWHWRPPDLPSTTSSASCRRSLRRPPPPALLRSDAALQTDNRVGWGLIVVAVGGVGALISALGTRHEP